MPNRHEHAELLRVVGRILDMETAEQIEIIQHPTCLSVSWCREGELKQRAFRDVGLDYLRRQARRLRGTYDTGGTGEHEELLRTLGQELDAQDIALSGIVETPRGYRTSGVAGRRYFNELYTWSELREASVRQRARRTAALSLWRSGAGSEVWGFWRRWTRTPRKNQEATGAFVGRGNVSS